MSSSLPKFPSAAQVGVFLSESGRGEDELPSAYLQRLLRAVVLANNQSRVAEKLGVKAISVAEASTTPNVSLVKFCRVAEAVDCEVILVPRNRSL